MNRKGINYDVGTHLADWNSRPVFDLHVVRRELEIIKNALRCNVVRISGQEVARLTKPRRSRWNSVWKSGSLRCLTKKARTKHWTTF